MAEQVNGIGLNVDSGLFEVGATLPQTGSWSIGCDVTIEDVDASIQEVRVNDISLSGNVAIPEVSVDIDANNDKVMDLEIGIAASGLSTGITERQIVPYDKIVKITEFSPESINERKYASSALAAKRIYDLIKEGGAGLNEDELKAFLKKYGYVTEEYVSELLKGVSSFFYLSEDGQSIGTPYNIFSEKEISANGLSVGSGGSGSGEGGGLIRTVLTSSSLGSVTSNDNFTTFNAFAIDSIYKKVKSIEEGNVSLSNYYTKSESDARFALLSSLTTVEEKIREILSWFTIDENGNLRTELNLYSTKEISAGGFNGTGGSTGGGLISTVLGIDKFGTVTTNSNTSTFNAYAIDSLHKRIKNLEESEVDLTGYATEEWVMGRGFITASALAPYLKTTDFETWKTSSFNPVVSQVNTNKNNIAEILKWFAIDGDGNLYTTYNFYSTKEISSGGFDSGSNGTGGLIGVVYGKSSFGTIANEANNATFNAYAIDSLYKRIVSLENKEVDLTGYATEAWVAGQGFITSAALSPYMKTADANDTFATKTALNNLGKRVTANEGNIAEILKWFAVDSDGNLYTTYNFYSTKEISANGLSIGSGSSGGGLISQVFGTTAFGTIAAESNSATFNAYAIDSLYKRIVSLEGKATAVSFVPALTSGKQIGTLSIDGVSTILYGVDAYSKAEADGTFLKLTGGTISNGNFNPLTIKGNSTYSGIGFVRGTNSAGYLVYEGGADWSVTSENWAAGYKLIHSDNYNSYAPKLDGTGASGTWKIDINGTSRYLKTSAFTAVDANELTYTNCALRFISALAGSSTNLPATTSYQNAILTLSLHDNGSTAQLYFTKGVENFYYRSQHTGDWKTVAFTDSNVASATKLATARTIWGQSFDGSDNVDGLITSSGASTDIGIKVKGSSYTLGFIIGAGNTNRGIYDYSKNSWLLYRASNTDVLIPQGNVGIGTTLPEHKLHVVGNIAAVATDTTNSVVYASNSNGTVALLAATNRGVYDGKADRWIICSNGTNTWLPSDNVGIGTTAPKYKLDVNGAVQATSFRQRTATSNRTLATFSEESLILGDVTDKTFLCGSEIIFQLVIGQRVATITSTGFGIGTNAPEHKLHVNGNVAATATDTTPRSFRAINTNGTISLLSSTSRGVYDSTNSRWLIGTNGTNSFLLCGNVGIGTDAPVYKLDVNGSMNVVASDATGRHIHVTNSVGKMSLHVAASGRRGLYDSTIDNWMIYTDSTSVYFPSKPLSITHAVTMSSSLSVSGLLTANSGVKVASGQALTFLDASGKEHKLTYDSTAGAFKFDGNILVLGDGQFNAIN